MTRLRAASLAIALVATSAPLAGHPRPRQSASVSESVERLAALGTDEARRAFLDAHGDVVTGELQHALSVKGNELRRQGRLEEATNAFMACRDVAERRGDRTGMANTLVNYSSIPGQQADYDAALAALRQAQAIGEEAHDNTVISSALTNMAIVYRLNGDYDRSLETNRQSLELAIAAKDLDTQGRVYSNMGLVYGSQGHFREALDAYEKSLAIKQQTPGADIAVTLNNIGIVHDEQGNVDLALEYYTRALSTYTGAAAESASAANELSNIGTVYRTMSRLDRAREYFEQARAIYQRTGNRIGVATSAYNLATLDRRENRSREALDGFRRSLELREAINDRAGIIESLHAYAEMQFELGQHEAALTSVARAIAMARVLKSNELLWEPLKAEGDFKHAMHDSVGAEKSYRDAIETIETIRSEVAGGGDSRRRFLEDKLETYHNLTTVLLEQDKVTEAFAVAERARGRVLADVLSGGDAAVRPLTAEERDKQHALERDVVAATARLNAAERRQPRSAAATDDATVRLRRARLANDEYRDALDARYPVRRLARGDVAEDPAASFADLLPDARTAIVEYVVTDTVTDIFVATHDDLGVVGPRLTTFTVPVSKNDLTARADAFRAKLASRALDFHADARALYDLVLKPAATVLAGRTRLVIIPDDVLWTIPFEALEPARDRALIDGAAVSYAPSVVVLRAMRERQRALSTRGGPPRVMVAADPESDLPRLPDAERQARMLAELYGPNRTQLFVGASATEPRVRAAATDASVLHFATHGVVDDGNPMYSFLQLTRAGQKDADTDGRLEAWEIQSLRLNAAVAVLTACDTARGRIGGGEGVIGLAWAFFAAGTPATVVSLWKLESGSATALTLGLHERLRASLLRGHADVAEGLRAAALELRRDARYRHPFYWAGLVAVGAGY
ncbi:MAG: CHAT domain-containing protein [Vicinamibacterales bacterium]